MEQAKEAESMLGGVTDWRPEVYDVTENESGIQVGIVFVSESLGQKLPAPRFTVQSKQQLEAQCRAFLTAKPEREARKAEIYAGMTLDLSEPEPEAPREPTEEERARAAFFVAFAAYENALRYVGMPQHDVSAAFDAAARLFKPEYVRVV